MKEITFIKNSLPYNGGESATFEDARADEYIAKGYAVEAKAEPAAVTGGASSDADAEPAADVKPKKPKPAKEAAGAEQPGASG
jgi:hypothetical protein